MSGVEQFGRFVRVVVGTGPDTALDVSDLHTTFKITRKLSAHAGSCELEILNLTTAQTHAITSAPRRRTYVAVDAGYSNATGRNVSRLFTGDMHTAIPSVEGPTDKLTVTAGDGIHALRNARVRRSFAPGSSVTAVVQHLAESMGLGIGNAAEVLRGARLASGGDVFEDGTMLHGRAADELGRLCDSAALEWSAQDGNLVLLRLGEGSAHTAVRIAADSGMVGSPQIVDRRTVKVKCLIQPGLVPGQRVAIESRLIVGTYRIHESAFTGSNFDGDFTAELTCQVPRPPLLDRSAPGETAVDS